MSNETYEPMTDDEYTEYWDNAEYDYDDDHLPCGCCACCGCECDLDYYWDPEAFEEPDDFEEMY